MTEPQASEAVVEQRHWNWARDWWNNKRGFGGDHLRQLAEAFARFEATLRPAIEAEERERCARIAQSWKSSLTPGSEDRHHGHREAASNIAAAIRDHRTKGRVK